MYPETHNFSANAAQASVVNAGQFGSIFAPHPCKTCEAKGHAYDAERPAHPIRSAQEVFSALFARKPQWK